MIYFPYKKGNTVHKKKFTFIIPNGFINPHYVDYNIKPGYYRLRIDEQQTKETQLNFDVYDIATKMWLNENIAGNAVNFKKDSHIHYENACKNLLYFVKTTEYIKKLMVVFKLNQLDSLYDFQVLVFLNTEERNKSYFKKETNLPTEIISGYKRGQSLFFIKPPIKKNIPTPELIR